VTRPDSEGWECGDCSLPEEGAFRIDVVCHHCGKLLCKDHRRELPDEAFSGPLVSEHRIAVHCDECLELHHRIALPWTQRR